MAVLPNCPGLEVTIQVDGKPLQEYDGPARPPTDQSIHFVSKYVEGMPDVKFTLKYGANKSYKHTAHSLYTKVLVNGLNLGPIPFLKTKSLPASYACNGAYSIDNMGNKLCSPIKFGKLKLSRDHLSASSEPERAVQMKNLGIIQVTFHRGLILGPLPAKKWTPKALLEDISERDMKTLGSLKGEPLSLRCQVSQESESVGASRIRGFTPIDHKAKPFATFQFHYRTKEDLQLLEVIERSPSPVPLEERDPATLSHAELLQLLETQKKQNELLKLTKGVKREPDESTADPSRILTKSIFEDDDCAVTEVRPVKRQKHAPNASDEVIAIDED
ncbi:hypothetical protein BT63DRAFT_62036 [Microthyrium microscopicum]|uniref:DUF7918 domain-containing protein n=1 Tax=Microthyrium microscopicum TaxID=703497 RepID=A0A6A6TZR5_9PEZI|nr:hypothetical protein BT63DRAFT_62036 [Microthyrium microscopicum]